MGTHTLGRERKAHSLGKDGRLTLDFSLQRWALSGFLKDPSLAEKQLVAMGDLATNRIPSLPAPRHRPSPVSCYPGNLSVSAWWPAWRSFMFSPLGPNQSAPAERMRTLKAGQFAAIKMREEAASRAMQALALAIFDASLLHLLQSLFSYEGWTEPRKQARSKPSALVQRVIIATSPADYRLPVNTQ